MTVYNKDELVNKLLRLHETLEQVKKDKKSAARDYRDQIKDIEDEISDVINKINETKKANIGDGHDSK